jgi:hypothetical protein
MMMAKSIPSTIAIASSHHRDLHRAPQALDQLVAVVRVEERERSITRCGGGIRNRRRGFSS